MKVLELCILPYWPIYVFSTLLTLHTQYANKVYRVISLCVCVYAFSVIILYTWCPVLVMQFSCGRICCSSAVYYVEL